MLSFSLKILCLLLSLTYIIYLPVAIFKSDLFLFLLDLVVLLGTTATFFSKKWMLSLSSNYGIYILFLFYILSILVAFFLQSDMADISALKNLRNLTFGVCIFVISSTHITDKVGLHALLKTILWGSLLVGIYGYKQMFFGFWDFELDRLAIMGSSLAEMDILERFRITSTFGDPLLCGFFMMVAVYVYLASRQLNLVPMITRFSHPIGLIIILGILMGSLTRAPLFGMVCGMAVAAVFNFVLTPKISIRVIFSLIFIIICISVIILIVESDLLADSNNNFIKTVNSALSSAWSLTQIFVSTDNSSNSFLVEESRNQRAEAWRKSLNYLMENPFGAGLSAVRIFDFSMGDAGILKIALLIGVPGVFAMLLILVLIFIKGTYQLFFLVAIKEKKIAILFLGLWVSILVTNGISSMLDSSVASILIWTAAGININLGRIFPINKKVVPKKPFQHISL